MNYLERNGLLLGEIARHRMVRGPQIGSTSRTTVWSVGSFISGTLGSELFVAFKRTKNADITVDTELRVGQAIEQRYPQLLPMMPLFTGVVIDQNNVELGIVTEDFSQGSRYKVTSLKRGDPRLSAAFGELFRNHRDFEYEIAKACFEVNGNIRVGDFSSLLVDMDLEVLDEDFPCENVWSNLPKYSLKIDYEI